MKELCTYATIMCGIACVFITGLPVTLILSVKSLDTLNTVSLYFTE